MAASAPLKRLRIEGNATLDIPRNQIELSSDSGSPPPSKRPKSTGPLHLNGFVKTAKATSSSDSTTNSRSRAASFTAGQSPSSLGEAEKKVDHADVSDRLLLQKVPTWSAAKSSGATFLERSSRPVPAQHPVRSHENQSSGSQKPSRSRTPHYQSPSISAQHDASSRPTPVAIDIRDHQIDEDNEVQISNSFTKPFLSSGKLARDISHNLTSDLVSAPSQQSSQFAEFALNHPRDPLPSSATKKKQQQSSQLPGKPMMFTLEVPLLQDRAPERLKPEYKRKQRRLLQELKKSTKPAVERLTDVEHYFGQNGFSPRYSTNFTDGNNRNNRNENLLEAASKKLRNVDRSKLQLDWGNPDPQLTLDEDVFDMSSLTHPIEQVKRVLTSRFNENYDPPITFANDINDRRLNGKFQFIHHYIFQPGVKLSNPKPELACDCVGSCRFESCKCLIKDVDKDRRMPVETYTRMSGSSEVVLSDTYIVNEVDPTSSGFEITECNEFCGCGKDCWNRVVERGRTIPLEIFQTARCGFGVRSSQNIIKGQFIELYLGEVITQQELERRENAKEEGASSYIFSLDFFKAPFQECYHVDGENFGTAMRFINHSCDPNARSFTVVRNKNDKNVHYVAFFAIRDIKAGEEICIDYQNAGQVEIDGGDGEVEGSRPSEEEINGGRAGCYCGAANCRKWLWPQKVRKRKKRKTTRHE